MKTLFAALNAKYIHTSLAVRSVAAYARLFGLDGITIWERTINHRYPLLLRELGALAADADVVLFSLYIWNVELQTRLAADLRALYPQLILAAAGPEASFHCGRFLEAHPAFDYVLPGEGEVSTVAFLREMAGRPPGERRQPLPETCPSVVSREGKTPPAPPLDLETLPFPYEDLDRLEGRILYYESMRGCPFRCAYCLSSVEAGGARVRYRPLERVFPDLERFLRQGVGQVKFVDRTFNCDRERALAIWQWLARHDNGVTGFHFEIAGGLLDEESLAFLPTLRPGLVQFEIGVQSTNRKTLSAIQRDPELEALFANVDRLSRAGNIHLHLDLIAGLPFEDLDSFRRSFNRLHAHRPNQLQMGFLKVLKGSPLEAAAPEQGLVYQSQAPYEVLRTRWLSFDQLCGLHRVADMVELYYNSGRFAHMLADMLPLFPSPFAFYEALAAYFAAQGYADAPPGKTEYYTLLGNFLIHTGHCITEKFQWLCRYDLALHEKPKKYPPWVEVDGTVALREPLLRFFREPGQMEFYLPAYAGLEPKQVLRLVHFERFPFHPGTGNPAAACLLFDYRVRDLDGHGRVVEIPLELAGDL